MGIQDDEEPPLQVSLGFIEDENAKKEIDQHVLREKY